uniref:HYC_CC_PP family protein n=1 Tax=Gelidibacter sp. TaxID=2018083 RepID=UPI0040494F45
MIKHVLHKASSILLALLVLFSTVSITIEKHFCGDVLNDVAVFKEAQKCAMEAFEIEQALITKKNCCKDVLEIVKGQDEMKMSNFEDLHSDQQLFLESFVFSYVNLFEGLSEQIIPHKNYSPPNLVEDIHILDQVFLI